MVNAMVSGFAVALGGRVGDENEYDQERKEHPDPFQDADCFDGKH
jgi:hypothetical protein